MNIYYCSQNGHTDYDKYWSFYNTTIRNQIASDEISDEDLYAWFKRNDEEVGLADTEGHEGLFVLIDDDGYPHICDCYNGQLNIHDYDEEICSKSDWDAFIAEEMRMNAIVKATIDNMKSE